MAIIAPPERQNPFGQAIGNIFSSFVSTKVQQDSFQQILDAFQGMQGGQGDALAGGTVNQMFGRGQPQGQGANALGGGAVNQMFGRPPGQGTGSLGGAINQMFPGQSLGGPNAGMAGPINQGVQGRFGGGQGGLFGGIGRGQGDPNALLLQRLLGGQGARNPFAFFN